MKTLKEYVTSAINGEEVESVEMGGMGDAYENVIQHLAQCMMLDLSEMEVPEDRAERDSLIKKVQDKWVEKLDSKHRFSGAQVGAATNLAAIFWRKSPLVALDEMRGIDAGRIIKIKNCKVIGNIHEK